MKRSTKILLGVASFWPIVYGLFFIAFVVGVIVYTGAFQPRPLDVPTDEPLYPELGGVITLVVILHVLTIASALGLKAYFIYHAVKNVALESNVRIIWIVVLAFAGIVAEPVYWYMNIWKEARPSEGPMQPASSMEPPDWR